MAITIHIIPIETKRKYRWSRWLRRRKLLRRQKHNREPFVLAIYDSVNVVQKTLSSRIVVDFGGLQNNINKYQPYYNKCFVIETPVKNGGK